MISEQQWLAARDRIWRDEQTINLNAGTLSPTPKPVFERVTRLRQMMAANPSDFNWRQLPGLIERSRSALADYLHAPAKELLLLPNVTFAINLIVGSMTFPRGSQILTTDHEYGAMLLAWQPVAERDGLEIVPVKLPYNTEDPAEIVSAFRDAITGRTAALFFSHVMQSTGLRLPVKELCTLARERNVLSIIDGAHAPGMVDIDLADIAADFYAANCHKWMMAAAGCGFLHVRAEHQSIMKPLVASWGSEFDPANASADSGWGGTFWQRNLEFHGTSDRCAQMILPEAIEFRRSLGSDRDIQNRLRMLSQHAREAIEPLGYPRATPINPDLSGGGLTAFEFPCDDALQWRDWIWKNHRIECPVCIGGDRTFLRLSTAWFNTRDDIDALASAIKNKAW